MRRSHLSRHLIVFAIACSCAFACGSVAHVVQSEQEPTGKRWLDMDYGPFLTTSVQCEPTSNIAHKGIAIPLTDPATGRAASVVFDTDLLRYAAGWTGGFIEMNGVVFDGVHGTFPAIDGEQLWGNLNEPGWADANGNFDDPREFPWGPLPRAHAHWHGLYLHGDTVILSYTVGDVAVLETPSLETGGDQVVFMRTLQIGPRTEPLTLQVASDGDQRIILGITGGDHVLLAMFEPDDSSFVAALVDGPPGVAKWIATANGRIRLHISPRQETSTVHVYLMRCEKPADFIKLKAVQRTRRPIAPSTLINGGPRRWDATLTTQGILDIESGQQEQTLVFDESKTSHAVLEATGDPPIAMNMIDDRSTTDWGSLPAADAIIYMRQPRAFHDFDPEILFQDLIGWWTFDEGQGDASANRVDGFGPVRFDGATWRRGLRDRSVEFDGTSSARIEDLDQFEFLEGSLTFAGWINTEADGTIFSHTLPDSEWVPDGKTFFVRAGCLSFDIGWVGVVETDKHVADGRWHHVAFTWDHTTARVTLFVDGQPGACGTLNPEDTTHGHVATLAYTSPDFPLGGKPFSGKMDELRVYRRVLSDQELLFLATIEEKMPTHAVAVIDAPAGAHWVAAPEGRVSLDVPADAADSRVTLLRWDGPADAMSEFKSVIAAHQAGRGKPLVIDRITAPDDNPWCAWMRFGGFDFFSAGGAAAICTWSGDVWRVDGLDDDVAALRWQRIATGLYQPLGLKIVDDVLYVVGRDQITRLHDLNGDGEADFYENFNNDTLNTEHFHEPCMDLQTDAAGNFYYMKGGRHAKVALHPHHGTLVRVSPDGATSELVGGGFRASNGLGIGPNGEAYGTDQEGYWMPANKITRVTPGGFHGNGWGWIPDGLPETYEPPVCWLHPTIDRSPSEPFWVNAGEWGLDEGSLFGLSYGTGDIYRVLTEEVNGVQQGGITPTGVRLPTGAMRARINPIDKQLYACGLVGWSSDQREVGGFFRVRALDRPHHTPTGLRVLPDGIEITLPHPLDSDVAADVANYAIQAWNYKWTVRYGSPQYRFDGSEGRETIEITAIEVSDDARSVRLQLANHRPVMQMHIELSLTAADGTPIETYIHNTIHEVPGG